MNPLELYEAYSAVYAPQEVDEPKKDHASAEEKNSQTVTKSGQQTAWYKDESCCSRK
jgi:hypothetical protein